MPSRNTEDRIKDILKAIDEIENFTRGMTFAEFEADPKTIKAVLYNTKSSYRRLSSSDRMKPCRDVACNVPTGRYENISSAKRIWYNMAIIGEVAASLLPEIEESYPDIPWIAIRGMRNAIIHEYFQVDLSIIWQTIQEELLTLKASLQSVDLP
ncbi:DUF86 domain-containing protein [Spirulina sp. 06S082]|uniref:HepT-like ribonuclease domain-containing protein n=1 Tax=Spirulina sp. 06S082 TaxID=3110248 RepID=UPI002B213DAE|nr:HepT-like ribonuclease domain-containing protein [Spirulina sp. 06S082]MEA5471226.1 HepT-like ribonuclease domain-containing protein [Spirulina sp. 06S082]